MELILTHLQPSLIIVFAAINLVSFLIMGYDKRKSRVGNNTKRTPEGLTFFMATVFGSLGVYAGMLVFRHKTKKWYFQLGIPLIMLQNLATLYLVSQFVAL